MSRLQFSFPIFGKRLKSAVEERKRWKKHSEKCVENLIRLSLAENGLIHSVPKSGVTWTLLVIANYWARMVGRQESLDFRELVLHFIPHSVEKRCYTDDFRRWIATRERFILNDYDIQHIIHTHKPVECASYRRALFLTRNPYDFLLSYHYFMASARGQEWSLEDFMASAMKQYVTLNEYQMREMAKRPEDCLTVAYEKIRSEPLQIFGAMLKHFGVSNVDKDTLKRALQVSSIDAVKRYEDRAGYVVAPLEKSFIRSGAVGDWREELSEQQVAAVDRYISQSVWDYLDKVGATG